LTLKYLNKVKQILSYIQLFLANQLYNYWVFSAENNHLYKIFFWFLLRRCPQQEEDGRRGREKKKRFLLV